MSINSTSSTSSNLLQSLNTISTPGGIGLPVTTYAQEMQSALQLQLTTEPNNQISAMQAQSQALGTLQTDLQAFQTATYSLSAANNWTAVTGTSSNPSAFTISINPGAQASNYSINIQALAQNEFYVGATGFSSTAGTLTMTGSFIIAPVTTTGGLSTATINITGSNDSLQGLVSSINSDTSQTGVEAGTIYNGSTYQLELSSVQTGSNYAFTITGTAAGQFGFPATANVTAKNASMTVDGVPITSQSNAFTNAIPNTVIQAIATGTGSVNLTQDTSTTTSTIQNWMNAYNKVIDFVKNDSTYTASTNGQSASTGPLFNDVTAQTLSSNLFSTVMQNVNITGSSLTSLAQVGIIVDPQTGHLEFQPTSGLGGSSGSVTSGQTLFETAYSQSSSDVQALFGVVQGSTSSSAIPTSGVLYNITNMLNSYLIGTNGQTGLIQGDVTAISQQQTQVQSYLTQINQQITTQVSNFTQQMNNLNAAMARSQAQSAQLTALINGSNSALTSSSSSNSTSSGG
jgi:flagellar hook-associated protein 2